jgi:spore coat polysaccharide biosynthesis protein SpsF
MTRPPILVQARTGSVRLPGKVLRPINGKPLLAYVVERLERCTLAGPVVLATSEDSSDDPLVQWAMSRSLPWRRGSLHNVARRLFEAARDMEAPAFVRVSGDSPFLDPGLVDRAVTLYRTDACDVASNVVTRSFPKGQSAEVVRTAALAAALADMTAEEAEHVTLHLYRHPERYRCTNFTAENNWADIQLSVDTRDDFERATKIIERMTEPHWSYSIKAVLALDRELQGVAQC